jgi:hypothetical protein
VAKIRETGATGNRVPVYLAAEFNKTNYSMTFFWILWGFDSIITLVVLYFFFVGLNDGSVSSSNMVLWLGILLLLAAIMGGSLWLKAHNHLALAKTILWLMAIPGLFYLLFILVVIIGKPRWN